MQLIHTCYRITDPERSVAFYEALGFEKRRELPIRDEAINIFMGLPGDGDRLELTYNFGVESYELGTGLRAHRPHGRRPRRDRSSGSPSKGSSPSGRPTRSARAAPGSASCATRIGTASRSSSAEPGGDAKVSLLCPRRPPCPPLPWAARPSTTAAAGARTLRRTGTPPEAPRWRAPVSGHDGRDHDRWNGSTTTVMLAVGRPPPRSLP